jgi:murein DD-endopeptidase MepM/ murein hydrolase activator NlpD
MSATIKSRSTRFNLPAAASAATAAAEKCRLWARETFPDRQILIRGPGNVSAVNVSHRVQIFAAAAACLVVLMLALSTAGLAVAWAAAWREAVAAQRLHTALITAEAATARAQAQYASAAKLRDAAIAQADLARDIAVAQADRARDLAVAAAQHARDAAIARANQIAASNSAALSGLIRQTQSTVGQVESVIKSTGLNPDELASRAAAAPAPFIPPARFVMPDGMTADAAARADLLLTELHRLHALGSVLAQLPLTSPTAQDFVSSGFGMRADPFTGAPEFHVGIDLPGPIGAPVYATAPGVVSYAGHSTGYGNLITIDHGYGLSTRYSHLDKILVRQGESVALHQEIGLMGNTGWSTGPHLLYETRVDGLPQNPAHFIKVNPYDVQN